MRHKKQYLIAGNWKMNKTTEEAVVFARDLVKAIDNQKIVNVALCPPFTMIPALSEVLDGSTVALGAQNMNSEASGAFTGEISAEMLREYFVTYVIIGHSERRMLFHENNAVINKKVKAALAANLRPILCVGETLEERELGRTLDVIGEQIREGLKNVSSEHIGRLVVAYEPVWAIGTGKNATPQMAQEVHEAIRRMLDDQYGLNGSNLMIIYGGSMKPDNAEELLSQPDVDGGLIGGASLIFNSFIQIIDSAKKVIEETEVKN